MQAVHFGMVREIQYVNTRNKPVTKINPAAIQNFSYHGIIHSDPHYQVITVDGSKDYLVTNGSNDSDFTDYGHQGEALQVRYEQMGKRFTTEYTAERTALAKSFADKVSGTVQLKVRPSQSFEIL
jgi:hypothetical protein